MTPKKETQRNKENWMFTSKMKPRLESNGIKFSGRLMEVCHVFTPEWNNLTPAQKAIFTQRAALVMKEDDDVFEEPIGSVPRKPNSYSGIVLKEFGRCVGANFDVKPQSAIPGAGRGVLRIGAVPRFHERRILSDASARKLFSEPITTGPPLQESATSKIGGRGHGRLSLLIDD